MGRDRVFAAWGSWVARFCRPVFAVTLAAVVVSGIWGVGVFDRLTEGGYHDPSSESTRAAEVVRAALGAPGGDVVVIYTPLRGPIDDAVLAQRVENRLTALPREAVSEATSYWADRESRYVSADRRSAVAVLTLAGADDAAKLASYRDITDRLDVEGTRTQVAGAAALNDASAGRSTRDLAVAEAISLPIVLVLLLLVFGSLVAAALPVLGGGSAVLGSLGVLHGIAVHHDVNSFAVNVASLLGLGMAIDYGLFMVGRFREEQSYGRDPADAVARTVATAGRTVLFSATLLMIALAGLTLFPQGFLKSLAYGGLAAVGLAALLSLTLLPAVLAMLGPRVDKLPVRLPRLARLVRRRPGGPAGTGWAALADVVLRRPLLIAVPITAALLVLAAPIGGVRFGEADERALPAADPARQAIETLKADFPALSSAGVQVVLSGANAGDRTFVAALRRVPGVASVARAGSAGPVVALTATLRDPDPFGTAARDTVGDIRALRPPSGTEVLVGGTTARNLDSLEATADRLPLMITLLVGATLVLMFLAFGSVLLPVKAVVMSALSLAATFGILVWIFQDGHGAGLLNVTPAPPEVGIVVLMAAVVFGLSTDYEVFLLSRMVEARTRGASTAEAVTTGLARTGRVISAAALLLIVVTGAFALSSVTTMRFVGVGMIIALLLDATVVRMLLVPAVLGRLGDAAWWAPGPLRRLQQRAGLSEYAGEELFPTVSVGRHAAPGNAVARSSGTARPRHASDEPATDDAPASPARANAPAGAAPIGASVTPASGSPSAGAAPIGASAVPATASAASTVRTPKRVRTPKKSAGPDDGYPGGEAVPAEPPAEEAASADPPSGEPIAAAASSSSVAPESAADAATTQPITSAPEPVVSPAPVAPDPEITSAGDGAPSAAPSSSPAAPPNPVSTPQPPPAAAPPVPA
ncbi:MAG TPA: MMPL family transporter, partial [Actinoplanes sp.]|nr:MMPL family transporter [Actinoplanes sp.]